MTTSQAHKQAARESKTQGARFVVYVPDEGTDVYSAEQCRIWASLVFVEATYVAGVQVATNEARAG